MTIPPPTGRAGSLRGRLLRVGGLAIVVALAAIVLAALGNARLQERQRVATDGVIEEQRIADRIISGVMRQLATISSATGDDEATFRADFDAAGAVVGDGLRAYLFRPLDREERLLLERVKEEHQQMEISAVQAARLVEPGSAAARSTLRAEAVSHALELLDAMDAFLRLREQDLQRLVASQARLLWWYWAWGGMALLLVSGTGVVLAARLLRGRVIRPLEALGAAARRIGAGDLTTRVPPPEDEEFREISQRFNEMADRLAAAQADLQERNAALHDALRDVQQAQADLLESEKLSAVGRMTAGLAHELNNPLASVLGVSTLLATELGERGQIPPGELQERYVGPIVREATRARLLIRSLLQFARRGDGGLASVDLADALQVVVELRRHAFEQAGVQLVLGTVPPVRVRAEPQQLQAVLLNLVNNALAALAPRGHGMLMVRVGATPDTVTVTCEDDGPGLQHPDRVFEPFYTTKPVGEGTGLGLALSRRFVEAFGGSLRGTNRPEGGARFTMVLPRTEDTAPAPAPASASLPTAALADRTVLVVEDEPELRALSTRVLARLGVTTLVAADVPEAQALLGAHAVDLIISDIKMPGQSGLDLHAWVAREHPALAERFLFVTGDVAGPDLQAFEAAHRDRILHKPFDLRDYLARVADLLA